MVMNLSECTQISTGAIKAQVAGYIVVNLNRHNFFNADDGIGWIIVRRGC